MNASDQIIKIIDDLSRRLGISIDWTQQNIIPQLQDFMYRYVKYETYTSIMWLIIGIILLGVGVLLIYKSYRYHQNKDKRNEKEDEGDAAFSLSFVGTIVVILGILTSILQIEDIIKVNTVPEVYFIDYIQNLIQK